MKTKKLNQYQLIYINGVGDKISILIEAKSELYCKQMFQKEYGMYYVVEIIKIM